MSRVTLRRPLPPSRNTLSDTMRFQIARPLRSAMVEGIQKGTVLTSYRHLTAATDSLQGILERNRCGRGSEGGEGGVGGETPMSILRIGRGCLFQCT